MSLEDTIFSRYFDIVFADKRKKMQKMLDRLSETCKEYGMELNVKKTKVMAMNGTGRIKQEVK